MASSGSTGSFSSVIRSSLLFSVFFKLITFIFNQLLIKFVSPSFLAFNTFLDFLVNSVVFFTSEGIRLSTQRIPINENDPVKKQLPHKIYSGTHEAALQTIVNLSYIPLAVSIPITSLIIYLQFAKFTEPFLDYQNADVLNNASILKIPSEVANLWLGLASTYQIATVLSFSILAILFNLLSEPFLNMLNYKSQYHIRAKYESAGLIINCIFNFVFSAIAHQLFNVNKSEAGFRKLVILIFTLGRFSAALSVYLLYLIDYHQDNNNGPVSLMISKIYSKENPTSFYYFNKSLVHYWKTIFLQLIFKNFLTEGDKFIFNYFFNLNEQGIYSIINNYGSLITRLVFNPIEESLKLYLSKLFASAHQQNKVKKADVKTSLDIIVLISKFYIYLSLLLIIFGYVNAPFLAQFLFTKIIKVQWWNLTNGTILSNVMSTYILYLPFLALNGVFEAFFQSISTSESIQKYSVYLSGCSLLFFANCYAFIEIFQLNLRGLILGNILNMLLRIIYCLVMIRLFFVKNSPGNLFNFNTVLTNWPLVAVASIGTLLVQIGMLGGTTTTFAGLIKSATLAIFYLIFIIYNERLLLLTHLQRVKYLQRLKFGKSTKDE